MTKFVISGVEPKDVDKVRKEWRAKGFRTKILLDIMNGTCHIQLLPKKGQNFTEIKEND